MANSIAFHKLYHTPFSFAYFAIFAVKNLTAKSAKVGNSPRHFSARQRSCTLY